MTDSSGATPLERQLLAMVAKRDELIATQGKRIKGLEALIGELEAWLGQNPRNSSRPPSSEGYTKPPVKGTDEQPETDGKPESDSAPETDAKPENRAARRRRAGKQKGAEGKHLAQVAEPDEVLWDDPQRCGCGAGLEDAEVVSESVRQVFDVPEPKVRVVEHRVLKRRCGGCHATTAGRFPAEATAPACYGPNVRALVAYFSTAHFVPVERCAQILDEAFGVQISTGAVAAIVAETATNLQPFIERARQLLIAAGVVCVDETGARIAGRLGWVHVSSDPTLTLLSADERRGKIGTDANGVLPNFSGVAVHDGWAAYRGYDCEHALCNAHHLRELQAAAETGQDWAAHLADTLRYANKAVKTAKANGQTALTPAIRTAIKARYAGHIAQGHTANPPSKGARSDAANLLKRLDERREQVLRFTVDFAVPFDNNQAERDLRPVKVQQKISGSWRTMAGAKRFCTTRSYISTLRKQGHRLLDGLAKATLGDPWLPAAPTTA